MLAVRPERNGRIVRGRIGDCVAAQHMIKCKNPALAEATAGEMKMKTITSTHGTAYQQRGTWAVQCRYDDGTEGIVSAARKSVFRRRLLERGLTQARITALFAQK